MSLLLDALKKAAQEKQNADSVDSTADAGAGLSLQPLADQDPPYIQKVEDDMPQGVELDLELDDATVFHGMAFSREADGRSERRAPPEPNDLHMTPTPSTVSDEALQLLIRKTNREHRKSRVIMWGGIVTASLVLLSISGLYFYSRMMDEIDSMHRKHQITLATLASKTRIEDELTSLASVPADDSPDAYEQDNAGAPAGPAVQAAPRATAPARGVAGQTFSVQRTDKRDPVSESLQRAWTAYQDRDYETSMREYRKVLADEPDNHDAMLGVAAVSLQQGDTEAARDIYIRLLERDPRDPHAHAGLANIAQIGGAGLSESRLKQLIEYRPDDAHLQFALGNLYVQQQSWPEAQQAFFNAWKADSSNADYAYNLAVSLDQLGKHREARTFYENSLKLADGKNIGFSQDAVRNRLVSLETLQKE